MNYSIGSWNIAIGIWLTPPRPLGSAQVFARWPTCLLAAAAELFGRIDVLAGQRLIAVTEVRPDRGRWIVERIEMHGVVPWRITSLELPRIVGAGRH